MSNPKEIPLTPYGLLSEEDQEILLKELHEGNVEIYGGGGKWSKAFIPLYPACTYRLKPYKLYVPWHLIDDEFKYAAKDADDSVWVFTKKPEIEAWADSWSGDDAASLKALDQCYIRLGTYDWKDSLISRQGVEDEITIS
jgi:hypothetical protein